MPEAFLETAFRARELTQRVVGRPSLVAPTGLPAYARRPRFRPAGPLALTGPVGRGGVRLPTPRVIPTASFGRKVLPPKRKQGHARPPTAVPSKRRVTFLPVTGDTRKPHSPRPRA